jgi:membrane protein required for colicin V production
MAEFNLLDWIFTALLLISVLVSVLRGFVREALSLGIWVGAFFLAAMFSPGMEALLESAIASPELRRICAFAVLFVATLLLGSLLGYLAGVMVKVTGLSPLDRLLGVGFGLVRGLVILVVLATVMQLALKAADTRPDWFADSVLVPHLLLMENWVRESAEDLALWVKGILG